MKKERKSSARSLTDGDDHSNRTGILFADNYFMYTVFCLKKKILRRFDESLRYRRAKVIIESDTGTTKKKNR